MTFQLVMVQCHLICGPTPPSVLVVAVWLTGIPFKDWISQFVPVPKFKPGDVLGEWFLSPIFLYDCRLVGLSVHKFSCISFLLPMWVKSLQVCLVVDPPPTTELLNKLLGGTWQPSLWCWLWISCRHVGGLCLEVFSLVAM